MKLAIPSLSDAYRPTVLRSSGLAMAMRETTSESPEEPAPPSPLSPVARRFLTEHGRRLYAWTERRRTWRLTSKRRIMVALDRPDGVMFNDPTRIDGIDVHLDRKAELWFAAHPYAVVDVTGRRPRFEVTDLAA
jgi:hypothetical protein